MKETPKNEGQPKVQRGVDRGRRDALRKVGFAAVAPMVLPARLLAQKTAKAEEFPPSERLNIGLIGMGSMMDSHMSKLRGNKDVFLHAVCDVDTRPMKDAQISIMRNYRREITEFGKCLRSQDHRDIIERDDIDAVIVATPVHWNGAIALDAIRSGKDVLVQSPMTLTVREGQLIEKAALHHGAIVQCVAPLRTGDQIIRLAELVRNGYIGKVEEIYVEMHYFKEPASTPVQSVPDELDYDRWLGPAPFVPYHSARISGGRVNGWRRYWDYCDRTHGEVGFDRYDLIQWALGREHSGPVEFNPQGVGSPYASYRYENGPKVIIGHPIESGRDMEFVGSAGRFTASEKSSLNSEPTDLARTKLSPNDLRLRWSDTIETAWVQSVKSRSQPVVGAAVGHRSSSICHLITIAERLGRTIKWDPKKEEIIADASASRMLDRPRRAPYTLV